MQALLQEFLGSQGGALTARLGQTLSLGESEAGGFLQAAATKVLGALQGGGLDPQALLDGDASALAASVDTDALAEETGVAPEQARTGLLSLAPDLGAWIQERLGSAGGLLELLDGGSDAGGLLGSAKKSLGGLFG